MRRLEQVLGALGVPLMLPENRRRARIRPECGDANVFSQAQRSTSQGTPPPPGRHV